MNRQFLRAVTARFLSDRRYANDPGVQYMTPSTHGFMNDNPAGGAGSSTAGGTGTETSPAGDGEEDEGGDPAKDTPEQQIGALRQKNRDLIIANRKLKSSLGEYNGDDGKPLAAKEAKEALKHYAEFKANGGKPTKEQQDRIDEIKRGLEEGFTGERTKLTKANTRLATSLERALKTSAIDSAIAAEEGRPGLLKPVIAAFVRVLPNEDAEDEAAEEAEPYVLRVLGEDGKVRYNKSGDPLTVQELVKELRGKDDYAGAFNAPRVTGGGSQGGTKGGTGGGTKGGVVRIPRADAEDVATYRRISEQARKDGKRVEILD